MFGKKKRFAGMPEECEHAIRAFKKSMGEAYVGTGICPACGHVRFNVSSGQGPAELPCPRCAEKGVSSTISFQYSKA